MALKLLGRCYLGDVGAYDSLLIEINKLCDKRFDRASSIKALQAIHLQFTEHQYDDYTSSIRERLLGCVRNEKLGDARTVWAETLSKAAEYYRKRGRHDLAAESVSELVSVFGESESPGAQHQVAWGMLELGRSYRCQRRFSEARALFLQIEQRCGAQTTADDIRVVAQAQLEQGMTYSASLEFEKAINVFDLFLSAHDKLADREALNDGKLVRELDFQWRLAFARGEKAKNYRLLGKPMQAVEAFQENINKYQSLDCRDIRREVVWSLAELAHTLIQIERLDEAVSIVESIESSFRDRGVDCYRGDFQSATNGIGICRLFQAKRALHRGDNGVVQGHLGEAERHFAAAREIENNDAYTLRSSVCGTSERRAEFGPIAGRTGTHHG